MHELIAVVQKSSGGGINWHDAAQMWQAWVTTAAIIVGGIFTYFKFFKDRVYRPRMNVVVKGGHVEVNGQQLVVGRVTIENKGSTKVAIVADETALALLAGTANASFNAMTWSESCSSMAFRRHSWIESGETVMDEQAFSVPNDPNAVYRLRFILGIKNPQPDWITKWRAWRRKRADKKTDKKSNLTDAEKEAEKVERRNTDEHAAIIDISAVTTVWPGQMWQDDEEGTKA